MVADLIVGVGVVTILLGIAHLFLPWIVSLPQVLVDPRTALRLPAISYVPTRRDVHGLMSIMNDAVSYALISIGVLDLLLPRWLDEAWGRGAALWIAGWWWVRAAAQLRLGWRAFDRFAMAVFAAFGAIHLWAAWR